MILDGWGINPAAEGNAIALAKTSNLNRLKAEYPHTHLVCSGEAVGLPEGIMGNSEVGHLNIGAGRVVYQDLLRIDLAVQNGTFFDNPAMGGLMDIINREGGRLHLMGLVSDGGVHSQLTHLLALLDMARGKGVKQVFVHAILDGRDTSPTAGIDYLRQVTAHMERHRFGAIASICGRYYAMDRDKRWDRIEKAYRLYTEGEGVTEPDPVQAVAHAYDRGQTDEFVKPIVITPEGAEPAVVSTGDGVIFFNFRADRAREITRTFTEPGFDFFDISNRPRLRGYVTMTRYDETFGLPAAFPPVSLKGILGEVLSRNRLRQLRIAETEKYAHVTYFFNGGEEKPFPNEERVLIPSPREVPTYDHKPEMSAEAVAEAVIEQIRSGKQDVIILNFANMDMVGHTGIIDAAVKACETMDRCAGRVVGEILSRNGVVLITADHGNAEKMRDENGKVHTAHTLNPVPFILVDDRRKTVRLKEGRLGDIAPTLLEVMGLEKSEEMTGESLIQNG